VGEVKIDEAVDATKEFIENQMDPSKMSLDEALEYVTGVAAAAEDWVDALRDDVRRAELVRAGEIT
jgi:hypothetical protein